MRETQTKKVGVGGILGGLSTLVESLGNLMERLEAAGGEIRREGEIPIGKESEGVKAVYGFSLRLGGPGGRPRLEPFGNLSSGKRGEPVVSESREPLLDVFDEPDHVLVVAELPGVQESEISLELNGDVLVIKAEGGRTKFYKELLLPCQPSSHTHSYKNGILEVRLTRPAPGDASPAAKTSGGATRSKSSATERPQGGS
jgi:HSP20 family protein